MKHQPITGTPATADDEADLIDFEPDHFSNRSDGWTAHRQRAFITALAETGCISEACHQSGITARSAYRLRNHRKGAAFAQAWDLALRAASAKLLSLAYERAVRGSLRQVWRDNKLVSETRQPSDKLLTFLLGKFAPAHNGDTSRWSRLHRAGIEASRAMDFVTDQLTDSEVAADPLGLEDYRPDPALNALDHDTLDNDWDA